MNIVLSNSFVEKIIKAVRDLADAVTPRPAPIPVPVPIRERQPRLERR